MTMSETDFRDLEELGWDPFFEEAFGSFRADGLDPGRVAVENRHAYLLYSGRGEIAAKVSGRLRYTARSPADFPGVGDWVAVSPPNPDGGAIIHAVLPRKSRFLRKVPGKRAGEQILAANVDWVFIVQGLDGDFNPRRLERYLVMAHEGGARPVVVLNKADLCGDSEGKAVQAKGIAPKEPVFAVSAKTGDGVGALMDFVGKGRTIVVVGSSGVGKSTLINALIGKEAQKTGDVREGNFRGRHTTTRREMILLPRGGILIDTPGLRELQLWRAGEGVQGAFPDVDRRAEDCRFADCTHTREPQCGVLDAVSRGEIPLERFESYRKLRKEVDWLEDRETIKGGDQNRKLREAQRGFNRVRSGKKQGPVGSDGKKSFKR